MKPFRFQQFSISQSKEVFRVGTDGVLLGALSNCLNSKNILEVGTGTGLISLMIAQRNPNANILAIDINPDAVELSQKNFANSPFSNRLNSQFQDFKTFISDKKLDLIVSNPPYFIPNSTSNKDLLARQQIELNFEQLIQKSAENLSTDGLLSVIIPKECEDIFISSCENHHLHLIRKVEIQGSAKTPVKRCVLEFSFGLKNLITEKLVLESSPRCYSREYLELTKNFHLFTEK